MGILSKELPPSDYWPRSFEMARGPSKKKLEFLNGASLGEEQIIDFTLSVGF